MSAMVAVTRVTSIGGLASFRRSAILERTHSGFLIISVIHSQANLSRIDTVRQTFGDKTSCERCPCRISTCLRFRDENGQERRKQAILLDLFHMAFKVIGNFWSNLYN